MIHVALFLINAIALAVTLCVIFGFRPFECSYPQETVDGINSLIADLCIGVMTSTLFYYIVFFTIDKRRERKIRQYSQGKLSLIVQQTQLVIAYYVQQLNIKNVDDKLLHIDKNLFTSAHQPTNSVIQFVCTRKEKKQTASIANYNGSTEIGLLYHLADDITRFCDQLSESPVFTKDDMDLVTLVSNMKGGLLTGIKFLHSNKGNLKAISIGKYEEQLSTFYEQYVQLSKYQQPPSIDVCKGQDPGNSIPFVLT